MKVIFIILASSIYLMTLQGAAGASDSHAQPSCKKFKSEVKKNWHLAKDKTYHRVDRIFLSQLDSTYRECINGLQSEQVIKIFGTPTRFADGSKEKLNSKYNYEIHYLISKPCSFDDAGRGGCSYFILLLDSNKIVKKHMTITGTLSIQD